MSVNAQLGKRKRAAESRCQVRSEVTVRRRYRRLVGNALAHGRSGSCATSVRVGIREVAMRSAMSRRRWVGADHGRMEAAVIRRQGAEAGEVSACGLKGRVGKTAVDGVSSQIRTRV
jgi:hypothetical protein